MKSTGNTIFIPGATSGIGLGLALRFHAAGNTVIIAGRRADLLEKIGSEHPGIETVVLDTTDAAAIVETAETLIRRFPDLDVLVNMAGIMQPEDVHRADFLETAEETIATNLLGPLRLIGAFVEHLASRPTATIMNVSSGLAFVPLPITPTYSATKAAIHSFSVSLRVQLADTSIEVVELVPPAVRTALMGQEDSPTSMPLDDFLTEVMQIIESEPDVEEILVERVKVLRHAEVDGTFPAVLASLSGR